MYQQLKRASLALALGSVCFGAFAQQKTIKGTVKDSNGEPMIGVSVVPDGGTGSGSVTDLDGNFTLGSVEPSTILKFTYIGYKEKKVKVGSQNTVIVTMDEDNNSLDELVVIGYGVVKKRDLTGSVASIKSDDLKNVATSNAMQAMQAKIPGMDLQQSSGESGSGVSINLRGARSMLASNNPLILVDGVAYGSTLDINPSDIESMEVLKDASSTAIYGTRGANGVIIITTKRGKAGRTSVGFNVYNSFNSATNAAHSMYGTKEVQRLIDKRAYQDWAKGELNLGNYNTILNGITPETVLTEKLDDGTQTLDIYNDGSYTDWGDLLLKNSTSQNYEVNVAGGSEKTNFNVSLGAMYDRGLMKKDQMSRYNGKVNIDHRINKIVKIGSSLLFTYKNWNRRNSGVYNQALKMTTITHPYLTDGTINSTPNPWYAAHCSPLLDDVDGAYQNNTESTRFFGNTYLELTPIKGLNLRSMFAVDRNDSRNGLYQDYQSQQRYQSPSTSYIRQIRSNSTAITWDNTINYNTTIAEKHDLTILLGHELTQTVSESSTVSGDAGATHYYESGYNDLSKILSPVTTSTYVKTAMLSFFGRLNYSYASKYLLTASLRADGSSTLAKGHKWGYFPSVAAGWRLIEESWLKNQKVLSNLKLRASWGISGNAAIDAYSTLASLSATTYYYYLGNTDVAGKIPSQMGNSNLTWEKTSSFNLGLDFGFLDGRISGTIDYYWNHTYDLLFYRTAPASSFPTIIDNIGKTKGQGLEVSLMTDIIRTKDFDWTANWSYSHFNDEITELTGGVDKYVSGTKGLFVGNRVNAYYDYKVLGEWGIGEFDQYVADFKETHDGKAPACASTKGYGTPGSPKIYDLDGDGNITSDDRVLYNQDPKHVLGMTNTFTYKDFSLSVQLMARLGGYISYAMNEQLNYESANWGDAIDYWTPTNTNAKFPSPGLGTDASKIWSSYKSAFTYEKADYFKIKDITLSYNVPAKWLHNIHMSKARVYCSMKNFLTWSKIDNYDPERGGSISFPMQKQVVIGLNVEF